MSKGKAESFSAYVRKAIEKKLASGDMSLRRYKQYEPVSDDNSVLRNVTDEIRIHAIRVPPEHAATIERFDSPSAFVESALRDQLERDGVEIEDPEDGASSIADYWEQQREGVSEKVEAMYRAGRTLQEISDELDVPRGSIVTRYLPDDVPRRRRKRGRDGEV